METQNLTDAKLNVMVAEACGWVWVPAYNKRKKFNDLCDPNGIGMARLWKDGLVGGHGMPKFSTSLDACATFEATITNRDRYCGELILVIGSETPKSCLPDQFSRITATPRQRCIAFLRMKGVL